MIGITKPGWHSGLLTILLLSNQQPLPAPPALAKVRQAFTAAHPAYLLNCPDGYQFAAPSSVTNVVACLVGDSELTLRVGQRKVALRLEQYSASYYRFRAYIRKRPVGTLVGCASQGDEPACFNLTLSDTPTIAALGGLTEAHFIPLGDPTFRLAVRRALATGSAAYFAPAILNDKGYLWQQLGYFTEARLVFNEVLRRYPTRAVAYLNRGDANWELGQVAAAQADYHRYLALLRVQQKDTTRVPAYVRLVLRLPT